MPSSDDNLGLEFPFPERADPEIVAWRAVVDALPTVVFTFTTDGSIDFANRRWYAETGVQAGGEIGAAWLRRIHPDDVGGMLEKWARGAGAGAAFAYDVRVRNAWGDFHWQTHRVAPMRDARGQVVRWVGTSVDIEDRRRLQQTLDERDSILREVEQRYRTLAESVAQIVWTADATGWIDWYNHRWYEYTGQSPEEAAGWGWQAAHHPEDFPRVMERWPHSIATGEPFDMEFRLRGADGVFRWFLTRVEPLRDESGKITRWYGTNTNIDEQRRALERTQRIAATLQDVFLPKTLPRHDDLWFDAVYLSSERDAYVGGDWYDAFVVSDGRVVVSIGDVAGHGLEASVTVGRVRQAIIAAALENDDPAAILKRVNRVLLFQEETIVTALVAVIDPRSCEVVYASAGHPAPIVAVPGRPPELLATGGLPLGVVPSLALETHRFPSIPPDSVICLYTDGMTEFARDIDGAERALLAAVGRIVNRDKPAKPADEVRRAVIGDAVPVDDAALLLVGFAPVSRHPRPTNDETVKRTWRFHSSDAYSAQASRRELMEYLRQFAEGDEDLYSAELILGEILANTVEHAPGLVQVDLDWSAESPALTVLDAGPGFAPQRSALPEDIMDEDGRGLFLVHALAPAVSIRPAPGYGTELRVVLPITRTRD